MTERNEPPPEGRRMVLILPKWRRWWTAVVELVVVAVVAVAVSSTLRTAVNTLVVEPRQVSPGWLVAAGLLYLGGSLPMAWFWWRTLLALGQRTGAAAALYAYLLGHLGKYVPGKALVIVIRVRMLRPRITSVRLGLASVLVETLTLMAVGAGLGAALSGFVLNFDGRVTAIAILVAILASVPALPPIARRIAGKAVGDFRAVAAAQRSDADSAKAIRLGITFRLLTSGWIAAIACWVLWGLSLWATLRAIGVGTLDPIRDLPLTVTAVSLAVVGGFVSMLPGGLIVRDALLLELLSPACGPANALLAAVLLRLVWLVSELGICGILELGKRGWGLGAGE
ncbi:MAG TPA: lysylphosphatidylglycerol synthase domain-containing protein [Lacipirellulaceae bacterium]